MADLKLKVGPGGFIETVYDDSLVELSKDMGAELVQVCRASNVEYEEIEGRKGWTVRAAHNPKLAIRDNVRFGAPPADWDQYVVSVSMFRVSVFETREEALKEEVKRFWQLLPNGRSSNG